MHWPHIYYAESEIIKIIHQLKNSKTNLDSMPVKIFKSISHYLSVPISKLVNESFSQGIFPDILKIARITPVYKSGSKFDCSNYRPISSLHYMSKLLEKCMSNINSIHFSEFLKFESFYVKSIMHQTLSYVWSFCTYL